MQLKDYEIEQVIHDFFKIDPKNTVWYEMDTGFSGTLVILVSLLTGHDDSNKYVLKIGPVSDIKAEIENRIKFADDHPKLKESLRKLSEKGFVGSGTELNFGHISCLAMVYEYYGPMISEESDDYCSYYDIFDDFVNVKDFVANDRLLKTWIGALLEELEPQQIKKLPDERFKSVLPKWNFDDGLSAILKTVAALVPYGDELKTLDEWWITSIDGDTNLYWRDDRFIHGDLRFANIISTKTDPHFVQIIDFANVHSGHVLFDLARFECDLLFRIVPKNITNRKSNHDEEVRLSSEKLRMTTLRQAFGGDFLCENMDGVEDEEELLFLRNPHLKALQILRKEYDRKWSLRNGNHHNLYRWFLLAEILRRLRWLDSDFVESSTRIALLHSILMLKQAISKQNSGDMQGSWKPLIPEFVSALNLTQRLGCVGAFVPMRSDVQLVNRSRNREKEKEIQNTADLGSAGIVQLIAETGNSYFNSDPDRFRSAIETLLRKGGKFQAVITGKYFIEAHGISKAYRRPTPPADPSLRDTQLDNMWLQKWYNSIESEAGYYSFEDQYIKDEKIEVKISRYGIPATILITKNAIFFEPYLKSDRLRRAHDLLDTFELKIETQDWTKRAIFEETFDFYYKNSDPLTKYLDHRTEYLDILRALIKLWN